MMRLALLFALLLAAAPARADAPLWNVSTTQSTLDFSGVQMGAPFTGSITGFSPEIRFDPETATGKIAVDIDLSTLSTGDKDRDRTVVLPEWLDLAKFPRARYEADKIRKTGNLAYIAEGRLTLKGISVPVNVDFTLTYVSDDPALQYRAEGKAKFDRSVFPLGTGEWADASVIANEIGVTFKLIAYLAKNEK